MAIDPIKGFYVHDEATDTDGVAKYDYYSLSEQPLNSEVPLTLNAGYLTNTGSVSTPSSAQEVYSDVVQLTSGDVLKIVIDSKTYRQNWLAVCAYSSVGGPTILPGNNIVGREVLCSSENFSGRRSYIYTVPFFKDSSNVNDFNNFNNGANVSVTYRSYGEDVTVRMTLVTSTVEYLQRSQARYTTNYFSNSKKVLGYVADDGRFIIEPNVYSMGDYVSTEPGEQWNIACFGDYSHVTATGNTEGHEPWLALSFWDEDYTFIKRFSGTQDQVSAVAPENSAFVLASGRTFQNGLLMLTRGNKPPIGYKPSADDLTYKAHTLETIPDYKNFEVGNISMTSNGWTYYNSNTRVRTKPGIALSLNRGDRVYMTEPDKVWFFPGYYRNGTYYPTSWQQSVYNVPHNAEYVFVMMYNPESGISSKEELLSYFRIETQNKNVLTNGANQLNYRLPEDIAWAFYDNVKSVNHRGFNTAPENTLPAYKLSKKQGFKYVETDVSMTSDRVPVLLHDDTINRTARNADGTEISSTISIGSITYQQALEYDFGIYKGSAYAGTTIPTFEEFVVLCRNLGLHPYIELKGAGGYTEAEVQGLVDIVEQNGMKGKVSWISFSSALLTYVKDYDSSARLGFVVGSITSANIETAVGLKTADNEVFLDCSSLPSDLKDDCISAGIPVEVWTVNSASTIEGLDPYISGVTSDNLIASKVLYDANKN